MHLFHLIKRMSAAAVTCIVSTVILCGNFLSAQAYTFTPDKTLHSQAAILYNRDTEQVLYEKNPDQPQMPGHLAQIMTAIVVMQSCSDLDGTTITADDALYKTLYNYDEPDDLRYADIDDGDTLTVRESLYAMMLASSCEASLILANQFGDGSIDAFVTKMNDTAAEIGCTATTFTNPTGLCDNRQQTTARDMLTITNYALSLDGFEEIATATSFTPKTANPMNHPDASAWNWTQANSMALEDSSYYYEGAKGIKTGNLSKSGRSIITEATQDENTYLVIAMNAPFEDSDGKLQYYHIEDATRLLNWAFQSFAYTTLLEDDEETAEVEVMNSDGNSYVLVHPKEDCILLWCKDVDVSAVQKVIHLDQNVMAPVKKGDKLGTMELKFSGEVIAEVPLVAVADVDRSFTKFNAYALENFPNSPWFTVGIVAGAVLSALYIALCIYASYRAKKNVTPEDPIHLVPHATEFHDRPQRNWKRSDTVFYHGPESRTEHDPDAQKNAEEKEKELTGANRR